MEPVAESPDGGTDCSDCDPVTVPDETWELARVCEEAVADDCSERGRLMGPGRDDDAFTGSFLNDVEALLEEDVEEPLEEEEPLEDVGD